MSPRKRNPENEGLPRRWKFEHGAYFYQVPVGQESGVERQEEVSLGEKPP